MICPTPQPPYYAVIFTSILNEVDDTYNAMSQLTEDTAKAMDGCLGNEHFRNAEGFGIHISYWKDMESIKEWKNNTLHKEAKMKGIAEWYKQYAMRICKVEHQSIML